MIQKTKKAVPARLIERVGTVFYFFAEMWGLPGCKYGLLDTELV